MTKPEVLEVKNIISRIESIILKSASKVDSEKQMEQIRILNNYLNSLRLEVDKDPIVLFNCDQDCPIKADFMQLKKMQYDIYHSLLFGPLARVVGLLEILKWEINSKRYGEVPSLHDSLKTEIRSLKNQVRKILEGSSMNEVVTKQKANNENWTERN